MQGQPPEDHKLCGFFCTVLSIKTPDSNAILTPGAPCSLYASSNDAVGFRTESGIVLFPVASGGNPTASIAGEKKGTPGGECCSGSSSSSRKKRRKLGPGPGNFSVVPLVHTLVGNRCLEISACVIKVFSGVDGNDSGGDARAVVLVDVYLPIAVWSGWQFPKLRAAAGFLFRHLSCKWEERNSLLTFDGDYCKYSPGDDECISNLSGCHVLGCKMHLSISGSSRRKSFELHEIFKSLPAVGREERLYSTKVKPANASHSSGIWDVSDDVLISVLTALGPKDLVRVASTCRHLRSLAVSIMPCMKLKLFPHQQAAVEWMLQRERNPELLPHPLFMAFSTEDGFVFYINIVSGEISTGMAPAVMDFCGGMFCDEPGLGKTITALSLILKTQGTLADPPQGAEVTWCMHEPGRRCGYYELSSDNFNPDNFMSSWKRIMGQNTRRGQICPDKFSLDLGSMENSKSSSSRQLQLMGSESCVQSADSSPGKSGVTPVTRVLRCTRSLSRVKRNLLDSFEGNSAHANKTKARKRLISYGSTGESLAMKVHMCASLANSHHHKHKKAKTDCPEINETWVQCDACSKWRKLLDEGIPDTRGAWFCSMNSDPLHQSCSIPEESWDHRRSITYLPGFYTKGTPKGNDQNVSFFTSVLKEHCTLMNSDTKKALTWLANLSHDKLIEMETVGLRRPVIDTEIGSGKDVDQYHKIFQAFGLVRRVGRGTSRWYYPWNLDNLAFDSTALQVALTKPLDLYRLYLSRATLVVVPANLVDHWKTQIRKHVRSEQLRIYVWTDQKKPCAHNLAWDYDIVITTFNRLSAEWGPRKRSVLMQVHWLRVMLDEGHTLGSSLNLTNKLQMAVSLAATNRWLLTGTPTPNTPTSQVAHLQPMLKFLHEEAYGQNQKSWEAGILRPFEAEMEEGRSCLLQLLKRCMISARKMDLQTIPPCIKKVTSLDFTEEHARSYNELVVTVRRNILMADWNDPSHVESLLNPKQWKLRSNTIRNVRLSCCVAGHIKVTDAGHDIQETMDVLVEQGLDPLSEEYAFIKYSLLYGGDCFRCKEWCRLPVITPCQHLLCLDCVALDSEKCTFPGCGNCYEMQSPEILTHPENPNPKWPVPKDLIELQPSYKQDDWDPDWQSTSSSKVAYLVERLKALQEVNKNMGYCMDGNEGADPFVQALLSSRKSQWTTFIQHNSSSGSCDASFKALPEKVIIFSQFLEHIHVIEQQLTGASIKYAGMYSPMHSSNKMKSLMIFQHDVNCMALLMDGSAALGLDLSFVTHVFLMEPIWDRSMEEQVISRAHRMGAARPVHVETLAMRGTIEEQMLEFLQDGDEYRRTLKQDVCKTDSEGARAPRTLHDFAESNYLSRLSFVRTKC